MSKPKKIKKPDANSQKPTFEELMKKALNTPLPADLKKKKKKPK